MSSLSGRRDWTGSQSAQLTRQWGTSANTLCCYYQQNKISSGLTTTEEAWPPPPTLWSPASRSHLWSVHCQVVLGDWGGLVCVLQTRQEHGDRVFNSKGRSYQMSGDNYLGSPCIRFFLQGNSSVTHEEPLSVRSFSYFWCFNTQLSPVDGRFSSELLLPPVIIIPSWYPRRTLSPTLYLGDFDALDLDTDLCRDTAESLSSSGTQGYCSKSLLLRDTGILQQVSQSSDFYEVYSE